MSNCTNCLWRNPMMIWTFCESGPLHFEWNIFQFVSNRWLRCPRINVILTVFQIPLIQIEFFLSSGLRIRGRRLHITRCHQCGHVSVRGRYIQVRMTRGRSVVITGLYVYMWSSSTNTICKYRNGLCCWLDLKPPNPWKRRPFIRKIPADIGVPGW